MGNRLLQSLVRRLDWRVGHKSVKRETKNNLNLDMLAEDLVDDIKI